MRYFYYEIEDLFEEWEKIDENILDWFEDR